MAPKIRISAKQVKKSTPKKKKKTKGRKKVPFKVPQEIQEKCKDWIFDLKKVPKAEFDHATVEELPSDDDDVEPQDDYNENPANYECSFRKLPKLNPNGPRDTAKMMLECEWNGCTQEFVEIKKYLEHINSHIVELNESEEAEDLNCKWSLCKFEAPDGKSLRRHLCFHAYHTRIKTEGADLCNTVKLPVCKMSSESRNVIPEVTTDYFCHWDGCQETFVSIQNFFDHVAYHILLAYPTALVKATEEIACKWFNCDKKYKQKIHMQAHCVKHTGEKAIACYNCGASFVTKYKMVNHLTRQMEGQYECSQCFRCFPTEKYLLVHMKAHVNYYKCTLCDMSCASKSQLAKHIRYRHIAERPFTCDKCDHKSVTKRDLETHLRTHDKEYALKCPVVGCKYKCRYLASLQKHEEQQHGEMTSKIYKCHICDKTFNYGKRLSRHLIAAHNYQYPPGHLRFRFVQDEDGFFKFQSMRLESLEVTKQIMSQQDKEKQAKQDAASPVKRIEDFDMMKKYLKPAKASSNIVIEVTDTDAKGNKIKSETFQVEEFVVN
ncbi:histone H4 transcription factor [Culicoides brevitarsis]|uniref:histone H4 transcription factor n=1 Tax=Culicoides brevitarsis TaxID=469753 RepID=UPI00307B1495